MALKGNAIIGQSGGPTQVINQTLVGIIKEARKHEEIENLYGAVHGVAGILGDNLVDLGKLSYPELDLIAKTPGAGLGSVRKKPTEEECMSMLRMFQAKNIRYFFYIGGNDSAETAYIIDDFAKREGYEMVVYHVPKTIDNDLLVNDHTPGFGSAAKYVAMAFIGDNQDNKSLGGIKINVVMGRHAGFLTAASILARQREDDGPHLVYVPERDFDFDNFLKDVEEIYRKLGRVQIAVSEGVQRGGEPIYSTGYKDSHGNIQLGTAGELGAFLADFVKRELGGRLHKKLRVRADTFGYIQRSFPMQSQVDAREAYMVGQKAVEYAITTGKSGSVAIKRLGKDIASYKAETFITPLESVARQTKSLPSDYISLRGNNIEKAYIDYVLPLVGELPKMGYIEGVI